jgi:hypothetical protein
MSHYSEHLGWLEYPTENEANELIGQINLCMGFPTPDGKTETWAFPTCLSDGYYPTATTTNYYVIIKSEIEECLTSTQIGQIIPSLPSDWVVCGTPEPTPSGSTENYI